VTHRCAGEETMSIMKHLWMISLALTGTLAVALLVSCASSQGKLGNTKVIRTDDGAVVEVNLKEYEIDMPDSIPAGSVTFKVSNTGNHDHTIRIEGNGIDRKIEPNMKGGETKELQVTLTAGQYKITCPVGPHATLGMRRTLTVTPREAVRPGATSVSQP
jgi:uncharacterized cupredoxin-like copper-binding protein